MYFFYVKGWVFGFYDIVLLFLEVWRKLVVWDILFGFYLFLGWFLHLCVEKLLYFGIAFYVLIVYAGDKWNAKTNTT